MTHRIAHIFIIALLISLFSGCQSRPYIHASYENLPSNEIDDSDKRILLSLMGSQLIEKDDRQEIHRIAGSLAVKKAMTTGEKANTAGALGDALSGNVSSSLGVKMSAGFLAASLASDWLSDSSDTRTSGAIIPKVFNGEVIESSGQARDAFRLFFYDYIIDRLSAKGFIPKCLSGCNTNEMVLAVDISTLPRDLYQWAPTELVLIISVGEFQTVHSNDPLSKLIGFDPAYRTKPGHSLGVTSFVGPAPRAGIAPSYYVNDQGKLYITNMATAEPVHFGRDLAREIHSTPFTFYGTKGPSTEFFTYLGGLYGFLSDNKPVFVDRVFTEPNLLDRVVGPQ